MLLSHLCYAQTSKMESKKALKQKKKAERAMAAARAHRPIRAEWANRFVASGKYFLARRIGTLSVLVAPFALMAALVVSPLWWTPPEEYRSLAWWASGLIAALPLVLSFLIAKLGRAVWKRSSLIFPNSEASTILPYLPSCPELLEIVRGWAVGSGDANLSAHEYALIFRVASARQLKMVTGRFSSATPPKMDEYFYALFPKAPQFSSPEGGLQQEVEREGYLRQVAYLDTVVGHISRVKIAAHAEQMGKMFPEPQEGAVEGKSRL